MRLRLTIILVSLAVITLAPFASASSTLDKYFSLRREYNAFSLQPSQAKADPKAHQGKVFELRGTLSGKAGSSSDNNTFYILECGGSSYVITGEDCPDATPGAKLCMLVKVGENCTISLSDLRLVACAHYSEVVAREQKAIQAEEAKIAAQKAKQAQIEANKKASNQQKTAQTQPQAAPDIVTAYKNAIKSYNKKLSDAEADTIARSILEFSAKYQVDPRLVVAVILAESHFNPSATSPKGAMGLGQLMPGTAAGLGVSNAYNPAENIAGSVKLIRGHLDKLSGNASWTELTWNDLALALASYNAGPGAVKKYGGVPPYRETQAYIKKVLSIYKKLCGIK